MSLCRCYVVPAPTPPPPPPPPPTPFPYRRLVKRIYIPLPDEEARHALISHLLNKQQQAQIAAKAASGGTATTTTSSNNNSSSSNGSGVEGVAGAIGSAAAPAETNLLSAREMSRLVKMTEGYSGSDLTAVRMLIQSHFAF